MSVSFLKPWGAKSWLVEYTGKYSNDRKPHVEVGAANMGKYKAGQTFQLANKHCRGRAIMYEVEGCENGAFPAHFTVCFATTAEEAQRQLEEF